LTFWLAGRDQAGFRFLSEPTNWSDSKQREE